MNTEETKEEQISPLENLKSLLNDVSGNLHEKWKKEQRPFNEKYSNWSASSYRYLDLSNWVMKLAACLDNREYQSSEEFDIDLNKVANLFGNLNEKVLPHLDGSFQDNIAAVRVFEQTMAFSLSLLEKHDKGLKGGILQTEAAELSRRISKARQVVENTLNTVNDIDHKISVINEAYEASDKLQTTLNDLETAKYEIKAIRGQIEQDKVSINQSENHIRKVDEYASQAKERINSTSERCDQILAKATGVGLAASFGKRASELKTITICWTVGLIVSLAAIGYAAYWRSAEMIALMHSSENASSLVVFTNYVISIVAIGAPIWFAWLATKQIGYNFRLSEDYAFKASISQAYEGYRREAHNQGGDLEMKILESIITRYNQEPLRYVAPTVDGSPLHEGLKILRDSMWGKKNKTNEDTALNQESVDTVAKPSDQKTKS